MRSFRRLAHPALLAVLVLIASHDVRAQEEPVVTCFEGTSVGSSPLDPSGSETLDSVTLRRTVDSSAGRITEEVVQTNESGTESWRFVLAVDGATFSLAEPVAGMEAMTVTGQLFGTPWSWDHWSSETTLPNGMRIFSVDTMVAGQPEAVKVILGPDGAWIATVRETTRLVSCDGLESRFGAQPASPAE